MLGRLKLLILLLSTLIVFYGLVGGVMDGVAAEDDNPYRELSLFTDVLNKIRNDYVEEPDMERALVGALHGMMEALDPYASFVDEEIYTRLREREEQAGETGLHLSKRYGYAYIVSVEPGSGADKEGLRTGDLLESIDDKLTTQMSLWEAERLLRGKPGSQVSVRVIRARRTEPQELTLKREVLQDQPIVARIIEGEFGLLRIPHFGEAVPESLRSKLKMLGASDIKGLLVDVRGASEGTLESAVETASFFLSKGEMVARIQSKEGEATQLTASDPGFNFELPIVLLIDRGTSGPAEVFAAALKDHNRADVVGLQSNGHGSIISEVPLRDGSLLYIATKLLYRPNGEPIKGKDLRESGIAPDMRAPAPDFVTNFYFENTPEDLEGPLPDDFYKDLEKAIGEEQLEVAIEALKKQIGSSGETRKAA